MEITILWPDGHRHMSPATIQAVEVPQNRQRFPVVEGMTTGEWHGVDPSGQRVLIAACWTEDDVIFGDTYRVAHFENMF